MHEPTFLEYLNMVDFLQDDPRDLDFDEEDFDLDMPELDDDGNLVYPDEDGIENIFRF